MAYNDVLGKCEDALATIITALALTGERAGDAVDVEVVTGAEDEERQTPFVCLQADDTQEEVVKGTGIYRVLARAIIESNEGETLLTHRARVASAADALMVDDIATQLSSAVEDFHVYDVSFTGQKANIDGNSLKTMVEMTVVCCGSAFD